MENNKLVSSSRAVEQSSSRAVEQSSNNYVLDIFRLIFILLICMMHFESFFFNSDHRIFKGCYLGVEYFFLLSGFFLNKAISDGKYKHAIEYLKHVYVKLLPYNISVLFFIILFKIYWLYADLGRCFNEEFWRKLIEFILYLPYEIIFLQMYLPSNLLNFPTWYISIMLFVGGVYCMILLRNNNDNMILLILMMCIVILMFLSNVYGDINVHLDEKEILKICPGLLRGAADMGIGIVMFRLKDVCTISASKNIIKILLLLAIAFSLKYFPRTELDFVVIMYMACFISVEWKYPWKTKSEKIINLLSSLRRLSIEIYFIHWLIILVLHHKWNVIPEFITSNIWLSLLCYILVCFLCATCLNYEIRGWRYLWKKVY